MQALQFALGGSARQSNRGTANKNYIRTDCNKAEVEIGFSNQGENVFKPVI